MEEIRERRIARRYWSLMCRTRSIVHSFIAHISDEGARITMVEAIVSYYERNSPDEQKISMSFWAYHRYVSFIYHDGQE